MKLNSQNKEVLERLNRTAGIAFALFEGTVKTMNHTLGLALGSALALLSTGCGITFPNSTTPVTEQPLIRIPDNPGPDKTAEATALAPTLPGPETPPNTQPDITPAEPPYMAPPLIPGFNPETVEAPVPAKPTDSTIPQLPTPEPQSAPTTTLVQAITRQADGLVYAPEATAPFSGIGQETDAEGRVLYEGEFLGGLREGEGLQRDAAGLPHREGLWKKGRLYTGTVYFYYAATDQVKLRGEYLQGRLINGKNFDRAGRSY